MAERLCMHSVSCPLCGNDDSRPVLQTPDWTGTTVGEFHLVRCRVCRHHYLNPAPQDHSLAACYPDDYGPHQRAVERGPNTPEAVQPTTVNTTRQPWYLSAWVRSLPGPRAYYRWVTETKSVWLPPEKGDGKRALEIGCSSGWFLAQLQQQGWSPTGVDLVRGPLAVARDAGFEVYEGTLDTVRFEAASFDAVFAWMVIEHVPRPRETMRTIHDVLKPGGWFAFSVPNVASWESTVFGRHWRGYDLPRHLQHFSPHTLRSVLDEQGFELISIIHQPSFLYWLGSAGSKLRHHVPRATLGETLMTQFENNPPLWCYLTLGPLARLNACLRQSGRLTLVTRRK